MHTSSSASTVTVSRTTPSSSLKTTVTLSTFEVCKTISMTVVGSSATTVMVGYGTSSDGVMVNGPFPGFSPLEVGLVVTCVVS